MEAGQFTYQSSGWMLPGDYCRSLPGEGSVFIRKMSFARSNPSALSDARTPSGNVEVQTALDICSGRVLG